jgi:hypothetical protein
MTYRIEFSEDGGYDSMYGAFAIMDGNATVCVVDLQYHGQQACELDDPAAIERGRIVAQKILDGLNASADVDGRILKRLRASFDGMPAGTTYTKEAIVQIIDIESQSNSPRGDK